ncbi:MAG: DUF2239 family protein [Myxococcota bacterium]
MTRQQHDFVAFAGTTLVARGALPEVAIAAKRAHEACASERVVVYDGASGAVHDVDLFGSEAEVIERLARIAAAAERAAARAAERAAEPAKRRGPGRPALGVVSREVTLLPRHWEWLGGQRGGASAALRRLVDAARKASAPDDEARRAVEAAYRFMVDIAGDAPGFEEASRALFARDLPAFTERIAEWPADVREQLGRLLAPLPRA